MKKEYDTTNFETDYLLGNQSQNSALIKKESNAIISNRSKKSHALSSFLITSGVMAVVGISAFVVNTVSNALSLEYTVDEMNIIGMTESDVIAAFDDNDVEGVSYSLNESDDIDNSYEYIVSDYHVDSDEVSVELSYQPIDVIMNEDWEGVSLVDLDNELNSYGFYRDADYQVFTDSGNVYVESNWVVSETEVHDGMVRFIVTNEFTDNLQDNANDLIDDLGDAWNDFRNN